MVYAEYVRLVLVMLSLNTFYYFWHLNWFNITIIASTATFAACVIFFTYSYFTTVARKDIAMVENN
jgi:hypothetical protein